MHVVSLFALTDSKWRLVCTILEIINVQFVLLKIQGQVRFQIKFVFHVSSHGLTRPQLQLLDDVLTLYPHLISILLRLQHLISQFQVLCDQLRSLLLLLLNLANQVLDHVILGLQLKIHLLILRHYILAFLYNREVNIPDVAHLVDDLLEICILLFKFNVFLDYVR